MIATVAGVVQQVTLSLAVVGVHGVGMAVHATPQTLATLREGEDALLHTSLVVREDSLTLFGFATDDERQTFEALQTVSGVGPRLALAMLAVLSPDELRAALAAEDYATLTTVPGVGKKGAQRMVLELGDKLGPPSTSAPTVSGPTPDVTISLRDVHGDVAEALVVLGWSAKQAEAAVSQVAAEDEGAGAPVLLKAALQHLGRS